MVAARLHSGLGNQMFQYAMVRRISLQLDVPMKIDLSIQLDQAVNGGYTVREYDLGIFGLSAIFLLPPRLLKVLHAPRKRRWSNLVRKVAGLGMPIIQEQQFTVQPSLVNNPPDGVIYRGYWQSERYFAAAADRIREDFTFTAPLLPASRNLGNEIAKEVSVCVNIRRGETLQLPQHNVTGKAYYFDAITDLQSRIPEAVFYVFSDDLAWCRSTFSSMANVKYVAASHYGHRFGNYMQLMSGCQHFIIPNSTFAWWAAWLGETKDSLVYAPERWFGTEELDYSDVVPDRWLKVPN